MKRVIEMAVEVNIAEDRSSANEIFSAMGLVLQSIYEQLTAQVLEAYQQQIVSILCSPSGLRAKKGLGLHDHKSHEGQRCRCRRFKRAGYWQRERRLRGERGDVSFTVAMVQCCGCGRRLAPVLAALELQPRQTHTEVLLGKVVEAIADTSYRRSIDQLNVLAEVPVAKSTAHRWAASVEMPNGLMEKGDILGADGTGFKKRFGNRGMVRLVLKLGTEKGLEPLGVWAGTSWEQIAEELADAQKGQGRLLLSDGERGFDHWAGKVVQRAQRGHWHLARDLNHNLWKDGVARKDRKKQCKQTSDLLAIEIPEEDFEFVAEAEKNDMRNQIRKAENELQKLSESFAARGYQNASTYLRRARDQLLSHLRLWLDTGIIAPHTTSIVENIIRELVRRLKKIGWNWSDAGATRMGRIVMIRRYDPDAWIRFWNERINLRGRCHIRLLHCKLRNAA